MRNQKSKLFHQVKVLKQGNESCAFFRNKAIINRAITLA
jgi:hypothetical protein